MTKPFKIPCVILCGGQSRRMGEDKSLLPFLDKNSLTQYQYDKLKPYFNETYLSSKVDKFDFSFDKDKYLILDKGDVFSPIVALQTIFKTIKSSKVFIITVDTPLVSIEAIKKLIEEANNTDICVAQTLKTHNLCGVFSTQLCDFVTNMIDADIHKVGYLLKENNTKYIQFENDDEFINLNNKDEYEKALSIISKSNK